MTKNPLINALIAAGYIFLLVLIMNWGNKMVAHPNNNLLAPMVGISLFTLSTAVMGYLFCYQPAQLYFSDKKKPAVQLFLSTVAVFAGITFVFLVLFFTGIVA